MIRNIINENTKQQDTRSNTRIECASCGDDSGNLVSERVLMEIIQNGLIKPSDLGRIDDPDFPEEKRVLLQMIMSKLSIRKQ